MFGIMLCASFREIVPPGYYRNHHNTPTKPYTIRFDRDEKNKYNPNPDKDLVVAVRNELESYNMIVGWNSKLHDIPFLNARLAFFGERPFQPHLHADMMWYAGGNSNKIGSKKLLNVQKFFKIQKDTGHAKTDIDWDTWKAAGLGDPKAMKEVVEHCEADVDVLVDVYWKLLPNVATIHR